VLRQGQEGLEAQVIPFDPADQYSEAATADGHVPGVWLLAVPYAHGAGEPRQLNAFLAA
jgi:hypothetical protein